MDKSDHDKGQPSRRELIDAGGQEWPFDDRTRAGRSLWLGDEHLSGGGGARIIWTSSRAATKDHTNWASIAVNPSSADSKATGAAAQRDSGSYGSGSGSDQPKGSAGSEFPRHSESYGEAKYVVDMLNVELDRRLRAQAASTQAKTAAETKPTGAESSSSGSGSGKGRGRAVEPVRSMVMCPGFVATELTPWFMKMAALIEPVIRPYLCGFNVKLPRGADALLRLGVLGSEFVRPDVKWITHRGKLAAASAGDFPREEAEVARAATTCDEWMERWRAAAGEAAGGGAPSAGSADAKADEPRPEGGNATDGGI